MAVSLIFVAVFTKQLSAQTKTNICGWETVQARLQNKNPLLFGMSKMAAQKKILENSLKNSPQVVDIIYTLPIVVHVIHTGTPIGSADNPTDASINDMITSLNNSWRKNGGPYGGVDMKIQFQLAVRSPECGSSTGIIRVNGSSFANYATGGIAIDTYPGSVDEFSLKSLSRWPNTDYINIWIVNKINGNDSAPGGFAYFAEYNAAQGDGIVLNASVVNGTNKTIVHEMGHVFELYHTFYDDAYETQCPQNNICTDYGDRVCDTEPGKLEYNCNNTTNVCTGISYTIADIPHNYTVLNNYMGYSNCQWMFTNGQKDRVRATLLAFRQGLITSGALSPAPVVPPPIVACNPTADNALSPYYGIEKLDLNTLSVYSNSSSADHAFYIDRSCNQRTTVIKGQTYPLTITGSYLNPCWMKAYIDYNRDGDFNDLGETLISELTFSGVSTANITVPLSGVAIGVPLRLRIISEQPDFEPNSCHLTGILTDGVGQIEDFGVIIANRLVESAKSGPWNDVATWACNCIPQSEDEITIKAGHIINVTPAMGLLQCVKINLETGSNLNINGSFKVLAQ